MTRKNGASGARGKVFAFLFGVVVGTLVTSLVVVNLYAGSKLERSFLPKLQTQHLRQDFNESQQLINRPKLRIEKSSLLDLETKNDSDTSILIGNNKTQTDNSCSKSKGRLDINESASKESQLKPMMKRSSYEEPSFFELARTTGTDKVKGVAYLPSCLQDDSTCTRPSCEREKCRPWGHFYHTLYQKKLSTFLNPDESFQLVEIGYNLGFGYDTYKKFFAGVPGAELHSIEISCIEQGPRAEGKWPWGNFAKESKEYQNLLDRNLLHCGDASDVDWLYQIWNEKIYRRNKLLGGSTSGTPPPLKIVVDDGSHLAKHMVHSVFFWFPRIEPGGILIIEDIQPIEEANLFRTQFLPQAMADLHFCGDPNQNKDEACFPQLYRLLQSIHCEMHICVLERNEVPAIPDLSIEDSKPPPNALDMTQCYTFANSFGAGMEAI